MDWRRDTGKPVCGQTWSASVAGRALNRWWTLFGWDWAIHSQDTKLQEITISGPCIHLSIFKVFSAVKHDLWLHQHSRYVAWCLFCFPLFLGKHFQTQDLELLWLWLFSLSFCWSLAVSASVSPLVPTEQRMLLHTVNVKNTITLSTFHAFIKSLE